MTRIEQIVVLAMIRAGPAVTADRLYRLIQRRTRAPPSFAAVYQALDRMACRGLADAEWVGTDPRARRHFSTTEMGVRALKEARDETRRRRALSPRGKGMA